MELSNRKKRERPQTRFMDVVKEDMQWVRVTAENGRDGLKWMMKIHCGDPAQKRIELLVICPSAP